MGAGDYDPQIVRYFLLEVGKSLSAWQSISGLDMEIGVIEQKVADKQGRTLLLKTAGERKYSNVVLKKGVDKSLDLYNWVKDVHEKGPKDLRVQATITMLDHTNAPMKTYTLERAWPFKYVAASLDASKGEEAAVEELHLAHEGLSVK